MARLLILGNAREILAGEPPVGAVDEVHDLGALLASLDGTGPVLVIADPERLQAEQSGFEAWLAAGGGMQAVLMAATDPADGDQVLRRFPFVHDLVPRPVTPGHLQLKLERALESIRSARVIRQLEQKVARKTGELSELNKIGVALSAERDIDKLLKLILQKSREITGADAGSLYLVEHGPEHDAVRDDLLRFKLAQNDSVAVSFEEFTIRLDETSIAGYAALSGRPLNVADAYDLPSGSPYRVSRTFDEQSGYRTRSMLVVPMRDHENAVIGVVQLINKKRHFGTVLKPVSVVEEEVVPFTSVDEELAGSLASQAAVAFENAKLLRDIRNLFDRFVHAAVSAIEQRDVTTRGHSERVAILTVGLARRVDAVAGGALGPVRFTPDEMREIEYAALLHDFGKVGVREKVLLKEKKLLGSHLSAIRHRFAYIGQSLENERLRARIERIEAGRGDAAELAAIDAASAGKQREVEAVLQAVLTANEPSVVEAESERALRALRDLPTRPGDGWEHADQLSLEEWARGPYLSMGEVDALSVRRGSLTDDERLQIQSHVEETYRFLARIPWTGEFRNVPDIAYAHHEKLDGSGYPRRLSGMDGIPVQSRMMTISDIYDALVAQDRPYKRAVAPEVALGYLADDVKRGKLDAALFAVFHEARIWDDPEFKKRIERSRRR